MADNIRIVCAKCGGENVSKDALARWCVETQQWEISTTYDKANYCDDCDGEVHLEERVIEPIPMKTFLVHIADTITIAREGTFLVRAPTERDARVIAGDMTMHPDYLALLDEEQTDNTPWEVSVDTNEVIEEFASLIEAEKTRPAGLDADEHERLDVLRRTYPGIQELTGEALLLFTKDMRMPMPG